MKNYDKNIESSYLMYLDETNFYGRAISQKLAVNGFAWEEENIHKFNGQVTKN